MEEGERVRRWKLRTLNIDRWSVSTRLHYSTQKHGDVGDFAFGEDGVVLCIWISKLDFIPLSLDFGEETN